ncbi:MAG: helix-hairpin-helix domain-containing protein [Phreatobacter sp.]|uniref:ComEA family DNA-binding protein n=1 Tax=Phreatobacter sp. TaxID=1966341 RepID=UPI001A537E66|nr:helix-hairpin-helix domain-containing protein [Phreatobacter sp.]MBL8569019.1 helix-hairpin-helix domain-containing protein [Phreatobacter sp.]
MTFSRILTAAAVSALLAGSALAQTATQPSTTQPSRPAATAPATTPATTPAAPARPAAAAPAATTPARPAAAAPAAQNQAARVNLNSATAAELDALPQIGAARAQAIVTERGKGRFRDWADFERRMTGTSVNQQALTAIKDRVRF